MAFQGRALVGPVAGLLLDAGDVLYDSTLGRRRLMRVLSRIGPHLSYDGLFSLWERELLPHVYRGEQTYLDAFRQLLRCQRLSDAQAAEVEVAMNVRRRPLEAPEALLPGVSETLVRLSAQLPSIGVLTNAACGGEQLADELARLGLAGRFQIVVTSIDLGCVLPEPAAYRLAAERLGLPVAQVGFVGHDPRELAGAASAGMRTIAFNHPPNTPADTSIVLFQELLAAVAPPSRLSLAG